MKSVMMTAAVLSAGLAGFAQIASAQTFSDATGQYQVGIGRNGELYDYATGVGLLNPAGSDYIAPGTPRDSWGITSSVGSAFADQSFTGTANITGTVFTPGTNSGTAVSTTTLGLTVTHAYNFFAPNILSVQQTVTNTSNTAITGVVFRRNVDLDVPPTAFNENTFGPLGTNTSVVGASYNGFENASPATAFTSSCLLGCNQIGDLGAGIDLGLGTIDAGQSKTFAYYYGINMPGQTLDLLFTQAQGLGLSYLIGVQSSENGLYPSLGAGSGFLGVSNIGTVAGTVPEPASWAMMIVGIGAAGGALRRRRPVKVSYA
jgi:hypothetical protein